MDYDTRDTAGTMASRATRRITLLLVALTAGCGGFPRNEPGTGFGQITISSPRVEGRDRLINDRREQEQWISQQITAFDKAGLRTAGSVDLRSLSAISVQAAASLDPNIKLDNINRGRLAEQARQDADDAVAMNAFRTQQRDQILADQKAGKITADEAIDKLRKLGLDPTVGTKSSTATTASTSPAGVPVKLDGNLMAGLKEGKYVPPDDMSRQTTAASPYMDDFNELLSGRDTMMNLRNDLRMDDLHDLGGNTLYRLTLNVEVLPQDDASAWAIAKLKVTIPGASEQGAKEVLQLAKARFDKQLDDHIWTMDRALLKRLNVPCWEQEDKVVKLAARSWTDPEHERAFRRAMRCATAGTSSDARQALEQILVKMRLPRYSQKPLQPVGGAMTSWHLERVNLQDGLLDRQGAKEADFNKRSEQLQRWSLWLGEVMDNYREMQMQASVLSCIYPPAPGRPYTGPRFETPHCNGITQDMTPEQRLAKLLESSISASVYAVTPRETVQRLSEVSSNRKAAEFIASLSGLSNAAGISAGLQSMRVSDAYYSALRRQPLVVGFTEVGSATPKASGCATLVFGWVLGPAFQISSDGKATRFRHTMVQRSVSADLVLPAWLDHVDITPETYWLKEDGTTVPSSPPSPATMTIRLPAKPADVLYAADARRSRTPKVERFQYLDVEAGKPASVHIAGENVWRSAEVLIGAQRANSVYLLNDGVIASFDLVVQPMGADTKESGPDSGTVALTLLTSDGTVEAGRVKVWSAEERKVADKATAAPAKPAASTASGVKP